MTRRPLCHLLYTNAPGQDRVGLGFRIMAVNFPDSADAQERKDIEDWLTSLKLVEGQQYGWAARGFSVERRPCFALALVDRSSFSHDDHGREGGFLAHTLLVLLEEEKPAGDFGLVLFDKARSFLDNRTVPPSLDAYLKGVNLATYLEIPEIELNNFRGLKQPFQEAFYAAACAGGNGEVFLPGYTSDDELPEHLLTASLALPPRLRLDLSWRVGLRPGKEGFVAHVAQASSPSPPVANLGTAYLDAVRAQLASGQTDRVAAFASSYWGVRSWDKLLEAFMRQEVEEIPATVAVPPDQSKESADMAKKRSAAGNAPPASPPQQGKSAAEFAAEFEAEFQDLQGELKEYIDQRLNQLGAPPAPGSAPRPPYEPPRDRSASGLARWRPEIYFLILLLLGGLGYWSLQPKTPPKPPEPPEPQVSPTPAKPTSTETPEAAQSSDPLAEWKAFVESPEAAQWFLDISNESELDKGQVSSKQRVFFRLLADLRSKEQQLDANQLANSRIGSFEYVHALWAKEKNLPSQAQNQVTLETSQEDSNIKDLVSDLGLTEKLGPKLSATDPKVQAAVTLAWILKNARNVVTP